MSHKLANGRVLSDDEFYERLCRQHRKIKALHEKGACDHPANIPPREWAGVIRGARSKVAAQAKLARGHAQDTPDEADISPVPLGADAAPREGIPMHVAFKGFDRVGLKVYIPPRE